MHPNRKTFSGPPTSIEDWVEIEVYWAKIRIRLDLKKKLKRIFNKNRVKR